MRGRRARAATVVGGLVAVGLLVAGGAGQAVEGGPAEPDAPGDAAVRAGDGAAVRGRSTLVSRELILANQVGFARGVARWRARELYRLVQNPVREDGAPLAAAERARAVVVGLGALRRDHQEVSALATELGQTRTQLAAIASSSSSGGGDDPGAAAGDGAPAPAFTAPVAGPLDAGFGALRDPATGLWLFRPDVRFRVRAGDPVRAPAAATVRKVADPIDGGRAVVLAHADGWTSILSGLATVTVSVGQAVTAGQAIGTATGGAHERSGVAWELWHDRATVDPTTVLRR